MSSVQEELEKTPFSLTKRKKAYRLVQKTGQIAANVALCYVGGATAMNTLGQTDEQIGPFPVEVGMTLNQNELSKLGLSAQTHIGINNIGPKSETHSFGPEVTVEITDISKNIFRSNLASLNSTGAEQKSWEDQSFEDIAQIRDRKEQIFLKSLGVFGLGAIGTASTVRVAAGLTRGRKRPFTPSNLFHSPQVIGAASALTILGGASGITVAQYDQDKLLGSTSTGAVAEAELVAKQTSGLDKINEGYLDNFDSIIALNDLIEQESAQSQYYGQSELVHIVKSDEHNINDAAILEKEIERVGANRVVMLGDPSDFGTIDEFNNVSLYDAIPYAGGEIPTDILAGNHDTMELMRLLGERENVAVVGDKERGEIKAITMGGLRTLMVSEPQYAPDKSFDDPVENAAAYEELGEEITVMLREAEESGEPIDLVLTHNKALFEYFDTSLVAGTMAGHTHKAKVEFSENGWYANPGSIGAGGLRAAKTENDGLREYQIVYYDASCQMIKIQTIGLPHVASKEDMTVSTRYNEQYDPALNISKRCVQNK